MEKATHALFLSKALPPHSGHRALVLRALTQVDRVVFMLRVGQEDPVPAQIRLQWLRQIYAGLAVDFVLNPDALPAHPEAHPDFWWLWKQSLQARLKEDLSEYALLSAEEAHQVMAQHLHMEFLCFPELIDQHPVSSADFWENPRSHWTHVAEQAKAYFVRKILITGPESTGKSTLAQQLSQEWQAPLVEEYSRTYFGLRDNQSKLQDINEVAAVQMHWEELAAKKSENGLLVCDTGTVEMQVWSELYFHAAPEWLMHLNTLRKYDLVLLLSPDIAWQADPLREFPDRREEHFDRLQELYLSYGDRFEVVTGEGKQRFNNARLKIKQAMERGLL